MIAFDSTVLIAAHRREHPLHETAQRRLVEIAEGTTPWALPIFSILEFVRVATHPAVFTPPSTLEVATNFVDTLLRSPAIRLLYPGDQFWEHLRTIAAEGDARGNLIFDAQIEAVCVEHGALQLVRADRDFARFPQMQPELF